jgi:hypothetical protein
MDGSYSPFRTSAAACANALTFNWISCFGVPQTINSDRGPNLLPPFGHNFAKCLTFHTNKLLLTTLSQTAQSKDCTAASMTHFAHAPPRQHGPRSYPLYSSDSEHSRGKTQVFPRLRQFSVPKSSCQMNFCKMNCQLMLLSKIFKNLACFCSFLA